MGAGDSFLVTNRGRVVAELRRPGLGDPATSEEDRALARLAASGALRVAERLGPAYKPSPISSKKGTAKSLRDADRGE